MITMGNFKGYKVKDLATWNFFKSVDGDIQKSFIKTLSEDFNANTSDVATMFETDRNTVDLYLKKYKIRPYLGRSHDADKRKRWNDFLQVLKVKKQKNSIETLAEQIYHGDLTFRGLSDEVLVSLALLCKGKNVTINVKW